MSKTKIITTAHWSLPNEAKIYFEQNKDLYTLICGGGKQKLESLKDKWLSDNCLPDDLCKDNISPLNPLLNEMTTIYLVYKNISLLPSDTANIGHNHYRRFFTSAQIQSIDTCDGIIADPIPLGVVGGITNVRLQYTLCHYEDDFNILETLVKESSLYNENAWKSWTGLNFLFAPCNLFVFKREVFNIYCSDIFPILLQLPYLIDVQNRDDYQKRALSFLAERLTSYWCWKKMTKDNFTFMSRKPVEHMDWKPVGATDTRGMSNGVFVGDQSLEKINVWLETQKNKKVKN